MLPKTVEVQLYKVLLMHRVDFAEDRQVTPGFGIEMFLDIFVVVGNAG